jgi:hypothetical protein
LALGEGISIFLGEKSDQSNFQWRDSMKKIWKYIIIVAGILLIILHWFFGTLVFSRFLYPGLIKVSFADFTVKNWLVMMEKNKKDYLKLYWPGDTIRCGGNIIIDTIVYKEYVVIPDEKIVGSEELIKRTLKSKFIVYESSPKNDYYFPLAFTVNIGHYDFDSLMTDTAYVGFGKEKKPVPHQAHWSISYVGRMYKWQIYRFTGNWDLKALFFNGVYIQESKTSSK